MQKAHHTTWKNCSYGKHPIDNGEELKSLELNQQYKYLGFGENLTIDKTTKSALKNKYFKRLKMILKSKHSS